MPPALLVRVHLLHLLRTVQFEQRLLTPLDMTSARICSSCHVQRTVSLAAGAHDQFTQCPLHPPTLSCRSSMRANGPAARASRASVASRITLHRAKPVSLCVPIAVSLHGDHLAHNADTKTTVSVRANFQIDAHKQTHCMAGAGLATAQLR